MFNRAIEGQFLPKNLSSDNDPLFRFGRWRANLRVLEVDEIKAVPSVPWSHPFVERLMAQLGESTGSGPFLERDRLDAKAREIEDVLRRAPRTRLPRRCKTVAVMRQTAIDIHGAGIVGGFFTPRRPLDYEFARHTIYRRRRLYGMLNFYYREAA